MKVRSQTVFTDDKYRNWLSATALEADATEKDNIRSFTFSCSFREMRALLERLKWAEKCADLCGTDENCCNIPELGENGCSPYELWRKAAGKI